MDPNDLDLYVICETTGQLVLACHCGPHEACPEHLLNCLNDGSPGGGWTTGDDLAH
jgi:hypothetical protein